MTILFLMALVLIGFCIVSLLKPELAEFERWCLSFPMGFGVATGLLFLGSLLSPLVYSKQVVMGMIGFFLVVGLTALRFTRQSGLWQWFRYVQPQDLVTMGAWEKYRTFITRHWLLGLIVLMSLLVTVLNTTWGPYDWDVMTLYDLRARILVQDQDLSQLYAMVGENGPRYVYYYSYPFATSIGHAALYLVGSSNVMVLYSFFYASFMCWLYVFSLRKVDTAAARIGLFSILLIAPTYFIQAQTAYTNFPYTVYLTIGMLLFFDDVKQHRIALFSGILIAFSMWVRFIDPYYYVFIAMVILSTIVHRRPQYLLAVIPIVLMRQGWGAYLAHNVAPFSSSIEAFSLKSLWTIVTTQLVSSLSSIPSTLWFIQKIIFSQFKAPLAMLVVSVLIVGLQKSKRYWFEAFWLGLVWAAINVGSILFALIYQDWAGIPGSAERMLTSLIPIVYVVTAMIINDIFKKWKELTQRVPVSSEIKLIKSSFYHETETKRALQQFISGAEILSFSQQCQEFERRFALYQGRQHAVFVNSGSSANLAIIQAFLNMGILKKGDAVGFSALTWSTNAMPLIQLGLKPVPVDVELDTLNV